MRLPSALVCAIFAVLPLPPAVADDTGPSNASLLWGPYRSNLYLGIRPRVPDSLLMGLMWGAGDGSEQDLRHVCEASDGMASYGWTAYDTRHGGTQTIEDAGNTIDITTEFVKKYEGQEAGNWALRVKGKPRENAKAGLKTRVVFYVGMEAMDTCADCQLDSAVTKQGQGDDLWVDTVTLHVKHPRLGGAELRIPTPKNMNGTGKLEDTIVKSVRTPSTLPLWDTKSLFTEAINQTSGGSLSNGPGPGDMHFVQFIFRDKFEFDILYSKQTATVAMTSAELTRGLQSTMQSFRTMFSRVFDPKVPFHTDEHATFSQVLLANLQGGLGYFHGDAVVDTSHTPLYDETTSRFWEKAAQARERANPETKGPYELFTHVPSQTVSPRGSLWDEGFHLLPILDWDADLALEVVRSWLALVDDDGWIAREQILGAEARSKVPKDFHVQYPHIANPPTLFWIVSRFVDMLQHNIEYVGHESTYLSAPEKGKQLVAELYPKLKRHYEWWRKTQSGDVEYHSRPRVNLDEGYRWRGRTPEFNYASGLDDYPRAEPPDLSELHVDALAWVGMMAKILQKLALFTENTPDIVTFRSQIHNIDHNLEILHWSEADQMYCDSYVWEDKHTLTCHKGYVSLFPFLLGFIGPDHPHLNAVLDLMRDPDQLWSDFGLRSLSPTSPYYGTEPNHWRGPIWININYLAIERLLDLAQRPGPSQQRCREMYTELRSNVVNVVYQNWKKTGYAWEQYDPISGHGQRTPGFTGWTALVVKMMAFPDLDGALGQGVKGKLDWAIHEAKTEEGLGVGVVVMALAMMVFVYITRKRFVGTIRRWRRKV